MKNSIRRANEQSLTELNEEVIRCRACPRLVKHREKVAHEKRKAYEDCSYWGRPVPSLGTAEAQVLIVGLAPGAHGANRTGRMFTGDSSGDFLFSTLFRFGFCTQPESRDRNDGLQMRNVLITAALRCVPPQNRPLAKEKNRCNCYLQSEIRILQSVQVVVALGGIAWNAYLQALREIREEVPSPKPKFGHMEEVRLGENLTLLGSYHPSRQNTQTGRLTQEMFDAVFARVREVLDADGVGGLKG